MQKYFWEISDGAANLSTYMVVTGINLWFYSAASHYCNLTTKLASYPISLAYLIGEVEQHGKSTSQSGLTKAKHFSHLWNPHLHNIFISSFIQILFW